jgi:putative ABC transport system permease protein
MNWVALKMLIGDRLKYIALVAGVAFAALLITNQASILVGFAQRTGAWVRDTDVADLWVMDAQVEFTEDIKPMLETALGRIRGVEGVQWAVPLYKNFVNAQMADGTRRNVRVIGLDDATLTGGPPIMAEGTLGDLRRDRGVLMNEAAPLTLDRTPGSPPLKVGDALTLNDYEVVVVGTYRSSTEFFWEPVLYTTYSRAKFIYTDQRKTLQYVLVKVQPNVDVAAVAARIRANTGHQALTGPQFEDQTMWWILQKTGILINFGITVAMGMAIGILVAGQTFFSFVLDNLRHFAALMAMGADRFTILRMLFVQVLVVAGLGYGLGLGGAAAAGMLFSKAGLAFQMSWEITVAGGLAVFVCCLIAGCLGAYRVLTLEPGVVFKG